MAYKTETMRTIEAPLDRPEAADWHQLVSKASQFKPSEVNQNSIIGYTIVRGFYTDPVKTIQMILDQIRDNAVSVKTVIGETNFKIVSL